jgi:hypothetical protein
VVIPDMLYGLRFNDEEEGYFMLDRDTGEMAIERHRDPTQTHFAKKIATYLRVNREERHVRDLGIPNFRVTTVTSSAARVQRMRSLRKATLLTCDGCVGEGSWFGLRISPAMWMERLLVLAV